MKKLLFILIFWSLLMMGCNQENLSENAVIAKEYLEGLDYEVVSYKEEGIISFNESELTDWSNEQIWGVQVVDPEPYLNKPIDTVSFVVKNHPLNDKLNIKKVHITVYIMDGSVIGGWSLPETKEPLAGAVYSLDGKTLEEIHIDYPKWRKDWLEKYGK